MASRCSDLSGARIVRRGRCGNPILALVVLLAVGLAAQAPDRAQTDALAKRAADRLTALQQEAESLAGQERTLLGDLRRLELDRQIKVEQLTTAERDAANVRQKLQAAN